MTHLLLTDLYFALLYTFAPWLKWILAGCGVLCAMGFGFSFGRLVPQWNDDSILNEHAHIGQPKSGMPNYESGVPGGGGMLTEESCLNPRHQSFPTLLWLCLTALLIWLGYTQPRSVPDGYSGMEWAFFPPIKWAAFAALAGYIFARLTDKGPVGPLE